jgi:hypothetical protein
VATAGRQPAEFGLLAALLTVVGLALGSVAGWLNVAQIVEFNWLPGWPYVLAVLGGGLAMVRSIVLASSLPLLRGRSAQGLREPAALFKLRGVPPQGPHLINLFAQVERGWFEALGRSFGWRVADLR